MKKPLSSQMASPGCAAELAIAAAEVRTPLRAEREQPLPITAAHGHRMLTMPMAEGASGAAAGEARNAQERFRHGKDRSWLCLLPLPPPLLPPRVVSGSSVLSGLARPFCLCLTQQTLGHSAACSRHAPRLSHPHRLPGPAPG